MAVKSSGNVFADLGFAPEEAANLKLRSQLMIEVDKALMEKKLTQQAAAKALGISQPRVSDLLRGKAEKFTIDALVNILTKLGHEVTLRIA
ncbi:MAG: XRE family transcriptional regulator [Zetaproteobacteria bacterium]|nr:XRE family transcriptional regulator [Zetaproteobacteria bacterium]